VAWSRAAAAPWWLRVAAAALKWDVAMTGACKGGKEASPRWWCTRLRLWWLGATGTVSAAGAMLGHGYARPRAAAKSEGEMERVKRDGKGALVLLHFGSGAQTRGGARGKRRRHELAIDVTCPFLRTCGVRQHGQCGTRFWDSYGPNLDMEQKAKLKPT
jgi:hypothetical protein